MLHVFENIYCVSSIYIASVTVDVYKMYGKKNVVMTANCRPSLPAGSLLY